MILFFLLHSNSLFLKRACPKQSDSDQLLQLLRTEKESNNLNAFEFYMNCPIQVSEALRGYYASLEDIWVDVFYKCTMIDSELKFVIFKKKLKSFKRASRNVVIYFKSYWKYASQITDKEQIETVNIVTNLYKDQNSIKRNEYVFQILKYIYQNNKYLVDQDAIMTLILQFVFSKTPVTSPSLGDLWYFKSTQIIPKVLTEMIRGSVLHLKSMLYALKRLKIMDSLQIFVLEYQNHFKPFLPFIQTLGDSGKYDALKSTLAVIYTMSKYSQFNGWREIMNELDKSKGIFERLDLRYILCVFLLRIPEYQHYLTVNEQEIIKLGNEYYFAQMLKNPGSTLQSIRNDEYFDCPICLQPNGNFIYTKCNHKFHKSCLNKIIKKECPMCKNKDYIKEYHISETFHRLANDLEIEEPVTIRHQITLKWHSQTRKKWLLIKHQIRQIYGTF
eukprot:NODE_70_length_24940_cov_0.663138.p5 type:complete len:445 gc:universal NODE_70_length_24940_cov_0.663138:18823-20157(+)